MRLRALLLSILIAAPIAAAPSRRTVANLPSSPPAGTLVVVVDGAAADDCTTGAGTEIVVCVYDGVTWTAAGGGGSSYSYISESGSDVIVQPGAPSGLLIVRQPGGAEEGTLRHDGLDMWIRNATTGNGAVFIEARNGLVIRDDGINPWVINSSQGIQEAAGSGGAHITRFAPTATSPNIRPTYNDGDTGIGWTSADILSLIAGGVQIMQLAEAAENSVTVRKATSQSAPLLLVEGPVRLTQQLLPSCAAGIVGTIARSATDSLCYCDGSTWTVVAPSGGTC